MSNQKEQMMVGNLQNNCNINFDGNHEYKGMYFDENGKEEKYFDQQTGAHFKFEDICHRLNKLSHDIELTNSTPTTIKIRKHKICKLRKHAGTELKHAKIQPNIDDDSSSLKSKLLARRVRNVDQKYSKTIKDSTQCKDEAFERTEQQQLLENERKKSSSQLRQDDQKMKAKIIENRRHIKNIIKKGKDSINYNLSEKYESRNPSNGISDAPKFGSACNIMKSKLNQDMTFNSLRRFHETTCMTDSQNFACINEEKMINKTKGSLVAKPPLINKNKVENSSNNKALLLKKNVIVCRRKISQQSSKSKIRLNPIDNIYAL